MKSIEPALLLQGLLKGRDSPLQSKTVQNAGTGGAVLVLQSIPTNQGIVGSNPARARRLIEGVAMLRPFLHFRPVTDLCHRGQRPQPADLRMLLSDELLSHSDVIVREWAKEREQRLLSRIDAERAGERRTDESFE